MSDVPEGMWKTKEGRVIPIASMTDSHLENTIKLFERKGLETLPEFDFDLYANPFSPDTEAYYVAEQEIDALLSADPEEFPRKPNPKYQELILERNRRVANAASNDDDDRVRR